MRTEQIEPRTETACLICETENAPDALMCGECFAPLALTRQAEVLGRDPRIVSVIGESNVGKTVYLGFLLDMLSQRAGDFDAIPQGPYSVDLQQTVIGHMAQRVFPPKTPMEADQWYWACYQVRRHRKNAPWIDLVMPDLAGESLASELSMPRTSRVISSLLNKSAGMMLLVDAALAANGSAQPDFFSLKMLSYVDGLAVQWDGRRNSIPIAVLLCKADHCPECFDDPRAFVKANLNRTWNLCESRFETVEVFATSVVGSLGYAMPEDESYVRQVPLHTALRGILEPFEWVVDRLQ